MFTEQGDTGLMCVYLYFYLCLNFERLLVGELI